DHEIEARIGIGKRAHVAGVDLHAVAHAFQRGVAQGDILGVARLIFLAPDIDARYSTGRQPAGDGRQHGTAAAAHVEHGFVAAQMKAIEDSLPFEELAAPGGVDKAGNIHEKEEEIEGHQHGCADHPLAPAYERTDPGAHRQYSKDRRKEWRIKTVVATL